MTMMDVLRAGITDHAERIVAWVSHELEARGAELAALEEAAAREPMAAAAPPAVTPKKREHSWCLLCTSMNDTQHMHGFGARHSKYMAGKVASPVCQQHLEQQS